MGLYRAAQEGDWEQARALHRRYQRVVAVGPGWIPALKGALSALGVCAPHVAPPNAPLSEERLQAQRERILARRRRGSSAPRAAPARSPAGSAGSAP